MDKTEFKNTRESKHSEDEKKITSTNNKGLKWLVFLNQNSVFGFDHLRSLDFPTMTSNARGISISFDALQSWTPPKALINECTENKYDLTLQLSFSLYHLKSHSFFGSTWMSSSSILPRHINGSFDLKFEEILYFLTRINDEKCIGVVEIVVNCLDKRNIRKAQYG